MDKEKKDGVKILVIGAHPDDCEFSMGGTAIKFRSKGYTVKFVSVTNGDAGHYCMQAEKLAERRALEVKNGCDLYGIEHVIMNNHDGRLEASIENRMELIGLIRKFKPDMIFTHRTNDYHPDHRNTAQLVQDSSYLVIVPNICPEVPPLEAAPAIFYLSDAFRKPVAFEPHVVVVVDDVHDAKVRILNEHVSQVYEWLPFTEGKLSSVPAGADERLVWLKAWIEKWDGSTADRYRAALTEKYGEAGEGIKCAEAFECSEYGGQLTEEQMNEFFSF